ncbi:MAG: hypothetical protein LBE44_00945 [Microbacterium hominis]|nr:hypothetical protein [Microbacterium hominis]
MLQSIPPRAPSRSSRANILSYTLHLATSSRLTSYSSGSGSRQLLQLAELERDTQDTFEIDEAWFDAEQKTQGLWKLGANLLRSNRREGSLPVSVLRRVELAELAEEALLSPTADRAITKIDSESVQASAQVEELVALKTLTAPDPTTLYHTTSASSTGLESEPSTGRPRVCSVAQSLIDLKFGGKSDPSEATSPLFEDGKPLSASPLDGPPPAPDASASAAVAGPSSTPHMDYRIVLSQSMRTRARSIFATSPLPSLPASYCRRHRVRSCGVCHALIAAASERESDHASMRRKNIPGSGLRVGDLHVEAASSSGGVGIGAKKPLAQLIPEFLKLSAALLQDVKDAANNRATSMDGSGDAGPDAFHEAILADLARTEDRGAGASTFATQQQKGKAPTEGRSAAASASASASTSGTATPTEVAIQVTAAWYDLLTGLLVQACLEGYLVDGWTGTEGVETLFGLGCGVWEGRGWSAAAALASRPAAPISRSETSRPSRTVSNAASDSEEDDDDDDAIDEATSMQRKKDQEAALLVGAGQALFGSRDVAQADYELNMRDRTQEVRPAAPRGLTR